MFRNIFEFSAPFNQGTDQDIKNEFEILYIRQNLMDCKRKQLNSVQHFRKGSKFPMLSKGTKYCLVFFA